jgi:hypothetical protein
MQPPRGRRGGTPSRIVPFLVYAPGSPIEAAAFKPGQGLPASPLRLAQPVRDSSRAICHQLSVRYCGREELLAIEPAAQAGGVRRACTLRSAQAEHPWYVPLAVWHVPRSRRVRPVLITQAQAEAPPGGSLGSELSR